MKMLPGVGLFGYGSLARAKISLLQAVGFKVEAVWAPTMELAKEIATDMNIPFYTNRVDDVLLNHNVDLVCISNPPIMHSQVAVKALGIGKHVMCEKPAGLNEIDAFKMVNAARYYPTLMSIMGHGLRFLPAFSRMKTLVRDGYVGVVQLCEIRVHCGSIIKEKYNWECDEGMGGGTLSVIGSHMIDIITYLINQKAIKVQGRLKTLVEQTAKINGIRRITSDDFCTFQMELDGGAFATITLNSHCSGVFSQELLIVGTKGRLAVREADLYGQSSGMTKEEIIVADSLLISEQQRLGVSDAVLKELPLPYFKGVLKLICALKDAFERREDKLSWDSEPVSMAATFEDGLYVQAVIDGVRRSNQTGLWEMVAMLTEEPDANPYLTSAAVHRSRHSFTFT
ncbi:glucose-fructose oxidoreductase domain-containing protein 2-like [Saccoglossus kowalevskii]|uniref:Glucose-fructose oxidoreductase domain-containing protein 1-like n=1 Tax=Saccoglossus kowalevskii TaxID=10224 RepID=A0ABM0GJR2_SACKO|nr:PREDICTED: glucose-fructose oxidoreductase domain-containing protein 1-like [Saccoglossus kowalevskii]